MKHSVVALREFAHARSGQSPFPGQDEPCAAGCPDSQAPAAPALAQPWHASPKIPAAPTKSSRAHRKLAMLQRSGLFAEITPGITIERARTAQEFKAAYRLVHDIYVERGYCRQKDWGMRLRIFEATAQMATFIAKTSDGTVVGVLSVVGNCAQFGLPSEATFPEEIRQLRSKGFKLCEVTNQAIDPRFRKTSLPTELMRCAMAHGIMMGYQRAIATVSPGHTGFYNLLNFFAISPTRSYSPAIHDPVVALCGDLDFYRTTHIDQNEVSQFIYSYMTADNPFVDNVASWAEDAATRFLDAELLRSLFAPSFLDECSEPEVAFIEEQWGWNLFDEVTELPTVEAASLGTRKRNSAAHPSQRQHLSACWTSFSHPPGEN